MAHNRDVRGRGRAICMEARMPRLSASLVVNRPVEDVFSYVASFENRMNYEEGLVESEQTSDGPFGLGATGRDAMRAMGRRMESTAEIVAFEANKTFTFKSTSGPMEFQGTWTFDSEGGGTRLSVDAEGHMKGLMKLFEPLIVMKFKSQMNRTTARLKEILESQS